MRAWPHPQVLIPLITLALAHFLSQLPIGARAYSVDRRTPLPELYHPLLIARDEDGHGHGHSHSDESTAKSATLHGDSHSHGHGHGKPLLEINETMISMYHKPTPPSYGTHDFDDPNASPKHPGMMGLHALLMSLAFFVALPIGIVLRSTGHALHGVSVAVFYGLVVLGLSSSALYKKSMPNMYEGQKHSSQGYMVLLLAVLITLVDALSMIHRAYQYALDIYSGEGRFSLATVWRTVILNQGHKDVSTSEFTGKPDHEYARLVTEDAEPEDHESKPIDPIIPSGGGRDDHLEQYPTEQWANDVRRHHALHRDQGSTWRQSLASDGTLFHSVRRGSTDVSEDTMLEHHGNALPSQRGHKATLVRRIGSGVFAVLERILVFGGYMQVISGIVIYTGGCRDSYVNSCLAHLIKGGIFWCYGLLTFARFLGSFSEYGWAWNRTPTRNANFVSAEFVECLVIFLYGITNTWMERFGIAPGTPYSTKEVQHISIAVMFWFAGLVGMGLESKIIRRWLASASMMGVTSNDHTAQPPSYSASFNPFPALVIGVTGAAMSAHAQVYVFQVQIHVLWGGLLSAFAVLRCLTYFFLWLGPPRSVMPSRPPTEALSSFFLACGGLMFQFSTEELTLAAMRRGHDDQMMFLNVAVAFTCLAFCWVLGIVALKGYLKTRKAASTHSS